MRVLAALVLAALLAGCAAPEATPSPERRSVDPPADAGAWRDCPPRASRPIAVPFGARAVDDALGHHPGIHRLDERTLLWVWASYEETLREDRITRLNDVVVSRDVEGFVHVCTRVDLSAPIEVDAEPRTYDVAAVFEAREPLPAGPLVASVNWIAGCPGCDPAPRGSASQRFD